MSEVRRGPLAERSVQAGRSRSGIVGGATEASASDAGWWSRGDDGAQAAVGRRDEVEVEEAREVPGVPAGTDAQAPGEGEGRVARLKFPCEVGIGVFLKVFPLLGS